MKSRTILFYESEAQPLPSMMKITTVFAALMILGIAAFTGCASAPPQDEAVLIQAGFHTVLPETITERNAYDGLPPYTVQRTEAPGHPVYAYHDKGQNVTYIGDEAEYKRYRVLTKQKTPEDHSEILTAQASVKTSHAAAN
jgi:hypothetical protein